MKRLLIIIALLLPRFVFAQTGSNQLAATAAAMAPGTWAAVPQDATNIWNVLQCSGNCGDNGAAGSGNLMGDALTVPWDWRHQELHYSGALHQAENYIVYYTAVDNTWHTTCGVPTFPNNACNLTSPRNLNDHGQQYNAVNPITGIHYWAHNNDTLNNPFSIWKAAPGDTQFTEIFNSSPTTYENGGVAIYWEGPIAGGDAAGNVWTYNSELNPGEVKIWHPTTNTLDVIYPAGTGNNSGGAFGNYNQWAQYSRRLNIAYFGGGNNTTRQVFMMDANQTVTRLDDAPVTGTIAANGIALGIGDRSYAAVCDPVTGYLLIMGGGATGDNAGGTDFARHMYVLNPFAGSGSQWTEITLNVPAAISWNGGVGTAPPTGVADQVTGIQQLLVAPIENYGVTMWVSCVSGVDKYKCNMMLYKYAATDFAARIATAGVKRSFGLDSSADLPHGFGTATGGHYTNYGLYDIDSSGYANCALDTSVKAEGAGSMHATIPATSVPGSGCGWGTNFSADYSARYDGNADIYVQWLQRMDSNYINNLWTSGEGWKLTGIGAGESDDTNFYSTCTAIDLVLTQGHINAATSPPITGDAQFEYSCTGSTNSGPYNGNEINDTSSSDYPLGANTGYSPALQNARYDPYCLYHQTLTTPPTMFPPDGNCFPFYADEWLTWQYHLHLGPRGVNPNLRASSSTFTFSSGTISGTSITGGTLSAPFTASKNNCTAPSYSSGVFVYWPGSGSTLTTTTSYATATSGSNVFVSCLTTDSSGNITSKTQPTTYKPNDEFSPAQIELWAARAGQPSEWILNYHFPYGMPAGQPGDGYGGENQHVGKLWMLTYDTNRSASGFGVANTWYDSPIVLAGASGTVGRIPDPLSSYFTYYTATTGNDSNTCSQAQSVSTPKLTVAGGLSCLASGDTLIVEDGTYAEGIEKDAIPSGVDASNRTTVRAANRGMVTLNTLNADSAVIMVEHKDFITIDGINADASGTATATPGVVVLGGDGSTPSNGSTYLTYQYGTIIGNIGSGCLGSHGYPSGNSTHITVSHATIHDCGYMSGSTTIHGLYVNWANSLIEYSTVYNTDGSCILIFSSDSTYDASNDTVNGNTAHNCGNVPLRSGSGTGQIWSNNVGYSGGAVIGGSAGVWVDNTNGGTEYIYNNTLYNNTGKCIHSAEAAGTIVAKNNICRSNSSNSIDGNGGTVTTATNTFTDPSFVNAGTADFHLQATSTAIGAGTDLSASFTTDADGLTRTVPWDLGAYRSSPCSVSDHLAFTSQPSSAVVGASVGIITVEVQDAGNHACAGDTSTITLSKHSGDCTGMTLNGTVSGANTFTTTSLNMTVATGSCSLDATDGALTGATSSSFTISAAPVTPHAGHIRFRK